MSSSTIPIDTPIAKQVTLSAPCTDDASTYLVEIFAAIGPNLIRIEQIDESGNIGDGDLTRALMAMAGVLVIADVIDIQKLESEALMVRDLRDAATKVQSLARDLIYRRSIHADAVEEFLSQYQDVLETTDYILQTLNQRAAYRFGLLAFPGQQ
jgi:hypothetical protein